MGNPKTVTLLTDILIEAGFEYCFAFPGGITPFLLEEFEKRKNTMQMTTIMCKHEGQAAVMADMYGRMTGKPALLVGQGVWMATNGGFGIVESFYAGNPVVIFSETSDWHGVNLQAPYQLASGAYGAVDAPNMYKAMTKYTQLAENPQELVYALQLAIKHANSGRKGPTCVMSRWNTLMQQIDLDKVDPPLYPIAGFLRVNPPCISPEDADKVAELLITAKNPIMICGKGSHAAKAYMEVEELAMLLGIPVATTYMGKSIIPEVHDFAAGSIAGLGQEVANKCIKAADVILVVGSALAPENTASCSDEFIDALRQKIVQIDIEPRNAGWTYPVYMGITSDAKLALREIIKVVKAKDPRVDVPKRLADLKAMKDDPENEWFTSKFYESGNEPIAPERIVKEMQEVIDVDDLLVLDGGNNRMWFTKLYQTKKAGQLIGPGGAAGMGWCGSAALTAGLLLRKDYPENKVWAVTGDGGFSMVLYVLITAKQYNLPIVYVVFNNGYLGNIKDFLGRKGEHLTIIPDQDYSAIAKAMGVKGFRVENINELYPVLDEARNYHGPCVVDIVMDPANHSRIKKGK